MPGRALRRTEKAVAELLNIEIDHYAVVTYANLQKIITYLNNGVLITLTENLDYTSGDGGYTLKLNGGGRSSPPPRWWMYCAIPLARRAPAAVGDPLRDHDGDDQPISHRSS